jgi:hypothetical protein
VNEYKKFVNWVAENDMCEGDKWIHRRSVDEYFDIAVVRRTCSKPCISCIVQSLQWFYTNLEACRGEVFIVKSAAVDSSINQQQENRLSSPSLTLGTDPRKGLKDVLSEPDRKKIASHIYRYREDWGSLNTSFSWGNNAGVRGASARKFVYADIFNSAGFGPVREGPRATTLLLVLRGGGAQSVHKDKFTTDRMVGCFRHRESLLCSVGALSFHVLNDLRLDGDINFLHG